MKLRRSCEHDRFYPHSLTTCPGGTDITTVAEVMPFFMEEGYAGVLKVSEVLEAMSQPFDGDRKVEIYVVGRVEGPALTNDFAGSFVLIAMERIPQEVG